MPHIKVPKKHFVDLNCEGIIMKCYYHIQIKNNTPKVRTLKDTKFSILKCHKMSTHALFSGGNECYNIYVRYLPLIAKQAIIVVVVVVANQKKS